jgi:GMP synthase (glutamine-hydrolysing)
MSDKPLLVVFTGTTVPVVQAAFGDFDAHFRAGIGDAWHGPWASVDARDERAELPDPATVAGVIVTGSSSSVTERAPWMLRLEAWLRGVVERETPLLGVCFGHQILAQALGGEVRPNPAGRRIGSISIRRVEDDPLFEGVPRELSVSVSHRDHVGVAPSGVRKLATADHDDLHAFAAGPRARAVQFHPEFHGEIVRGYIRTRRDLLKDEGLDPDALLAGVVDPPFGPVVLRNFVAHFVKRPV